VAEREPLGSEGSSVATGTRAAEVPPFPDLDPTAETIADAPAGGAALPADRESLRYRLKLKLLGPPLHTEALEHQRLGKPTALAVFASDNLSSSAYATEEILRVLVPAVGVAAFALVVPITVALLIVLGFLILSYRQTIKEYPSAGGAYVVTKDNFGIKPALVAGVSLLTDYILTVAVSVAAGTAALVSAFPALEPVRIPICLAFVAIIAFGNLRGVKESGRIFAVPTYFFLLNMLVLLGYGLYRLAFTHLPVETLSQNGLVKVGSPGAGLFEGAALFVVLHAFASGGAAVTGVEAISNGVPAFKEPAWKSARSTLVIMGTLLGVMFLGLSTLASKMHVAPFETGTPTVISEIGRLTYGSSALGQVLFYSLQAGTLLILVLAANTSFADFPRLASFAAADHFMPRQLNKRGHRLVYSNGILFLAGAAVVILLITDAKVDRLIPLYAIGVFTSFTLSQSGMAKHHITRKEPGWRKGLFINATGAVMSLVVDIIIAITKFSHGAWIVIVMVPILVALLLRLNRQYTAEAEELAEDAPRACAAPILRRHVVLVFLDQLDLPGARAIQYARALMPDEMRAVHFAVDMQRARQLQRAWTELGLSRITLEIVECPDRRLTRAALETVSEALAGGDTEVTVLIPRVEHSRLWHMLLHDRTSGAIADALTDLPHANVTFVPYQLGRKRESASPSSPEELFDIDFAAEAPTTAEPTVRIADVQPRELVTIVGRVHAVRIRPRAAVATMECVIRDPTGSTTLVFLGRKQIAGIEPGAVLRATGRAGETRGRIEIINPEYQLLRPVSQ
jgi:amino acid transporter